MGYTPTNLISVYFSAHLLDNIYNNFCYSETSDMSNKAELIKEMLDMQAKFIAYEQSGEFDAEDYYVGEWKDYRQKYTELAGQVRELASQEANFWK